MIQANIAALMEIQAHERPGQRAIVFPQGRDKNGNTLWSELTFENLNRVTDAIARGLQAAGVRRGDRTSLLIRPNLDYVPLIFALFKLGAIPVMIDPGMGVKRFLECLRHVEPRVLIAEPLIHRLAAFGLARGALKSVELKFSAGKSWFARDIESCKIFSDEPFNTVQVEPEDLAAILFTSGSTGPAKGVLYTHGILHTETALIRDTYNIQGGEIDLACFGLFGLFSMAIGMSVVWPEFNVSKPASADPQKVVEDLQNQACTSAFGSPAVWKRVLPYCLEHNIKLPHLKRVLIAGAPVPCWMHEAFSKILNENAQVFAPYGATEALPVASMGSHEILAETAQLTANGNGICVGYPVPGATVRIVRISDEPIEHWSNDLQQPVGVVGEIAVGGPMATSAYDREENYTKAAKIYLSESDGFPNGIKLLHRMGDVGYLDEKGRLWFCGRKAHRVTLNDGDVLFPVQLEAIFNAHASVARTALVGVDGEAVLCVELKPGVQPSSELAAEILALGKDHPKASKIKRALFHKGFPVDVRHNAKIDRELCAVWAKEQR